MFILEGVADGDATLRVPTEPEDARRAGLKPTDLKTIAGASHRSIKRQVPLKAAAQRGFVAGRDFLFNVASVNYCARRFDLDLARRMEVLWFSDFSAACPRLP